MNDEFVIRTDSVTVSHNLLNYLTQSQLYVYCHISKKINEHPRVTLKDVSEMWYELGMSKAKFDKAFEVLKFHGCFSIRTVDVMPDELTESESRQS